MNTLFAVAGMYEKGGFQNLQEELAIIVKNCKQMRGDNQRCRKEKTCKYLSLLFWS
jgi:hypothetical protein